MIRGSCLCGGVRYEIASALEELHHCHCSQCRKGHGAAFSTYGQAPADALRITSGEAQIHRFRSSPPVERSFCGACGSSLFFRFDALPHAVWIAAGTFDDDPGMRPGAHIFVGSKAPWHELTDTVPRFDGFPPEG